MQSGQVRETIMADYQFSFYNEKTRKLLHRCEEDHCIGMEIEGKSGVRDRGWFGAVPKSSKRSRQ